MKTLLLSVLLCLFSGCATTPIDTLLPEGRAQKARVTYTGKFSSTTVEAENFVKTPEKVTADRISLKHANAWLPNVEFVAEGYERYRAPIEHQPK